MKTDTAIQSRTFRLSECTVPYEPEAENVISGWFSTDSAIVVGRGEDKRIEHIVNGNFVTEKVAIGFSNDPSRRMLTTPDICIGASQDTRTGRYGLDFEFPLSDDQWSRDLVADLLASRVPTATIFFRVLEDKWHMDQKPPVHTIIKAQLVSIRLDRGASPAVEPIVDIAKVRARLAAAALV